MCTSSDAKFFLPSSRSEKRFAPPSPAMGNFLLKTGGEALQAVEKKLGKLIQKIYEVDPLTCPKCQGPMRVIAAIDDQDVIKKILHLSGLWEVKPRPPPTIPKAKAMYNEPYIDYSDSQVPPSDNAPLCRPGIPRGLGLILKSRRGPEGELRLFSPRRPPARTEINLAFLSGVPRV